MLTLLRGGFLLYKIVISYSLSLRSNFVYLSINHKSITMKRFLYSFTFLLFSTFIFSQSQERLSVHYFDVPQELESAFLKFNSDVNKELEKAGFGSDFYKIYKVKNDDKAESFRYFQISSYTSDKHYEMTHNVGKDYDKIWDEFWNSEAGKKIFTFDKNHIYRKVYRIEN